MACLMGGLVFAVIENLMYLPPWKGPHPQDLVTWRWTVCTALHAGCSLVTGLGIVRMWRGVWGSPPRPADSDAGVPLIATAAIIHGGYNLLVWLMPPV